MKAQLQATSLKTLSLSRRRADAASDGDLPVLRLGVELQHHAPPGRRHRPGGGRRCQGHLSIAGTLEGVELRFQEMLMSGVALDAVDAPLPDETLAATRASDAVLHDAIGGYKWDNNEKNLKPVTGLLQIHAGLGVFANLRPATVFPPLVDASTLKKDVPEGVDIMVVIELTGGIYFGKPRGFGTNDRGDTGFIIEIYSVSEIDRIARTTFEVARNKSGRLCSVDKANVPENLVDLGGSERIAKTGARGYVSRRGSILTKA